MTDHDSMPAEIDFSRGTRGLHHIPTGISAGARVFLPTSIERSVWEHFAAEAERKGVGMADLLSDVLKRDMENTEAHQ